jgi:hypothetical protein
MKHLGRNAKKTGLHQLDSEPMEANRAVSEGAKRRWDPVAEILTQIVGGVLDFGGSSS